MRMLPGVVQHQEKERKRIEVWKQGHAWSDRNVVMNEDALQSSTTPREGAEEDRSSMDKETCVVRLEGCNE
jgi:hypothetical protein